LSWNSTQWSLKACKNALRVSIESKTPIVAKRKTVTPRTRMITLLYLQREKVQITTTTVAYKKNSR
jgi:hypothetical protein